MANSNCRSFGGRIIIKSVNYFWAFLKDAKKSIQVKSVMDMKIENMVGIVRIVLLFLFFFPFFRLSENLHAEQIYAIDNLIGSRDSVLLTDQNGTVILSKNACKKLIPASTLKILTSLSALYYLGPDYRFKTEFYLDDQSNLIIKGYGDPLLISEKIETIAKKLSDRLNKRGVIINDIILDDSYFKNRLTIPGTNNSEQAYDAPNGALCVNFNTVCVKWCENGRVISAEPQTPLLPFALDRIKRSSAKQMRIVLTRKEKESAMYAGHMFLYFIRKEGAKTGKTIRSGQVSKNDELILRSYSDFTLKEIISKLLIFSNNFIANQIFINMGAVCYGPPGNLQKGVDAVLNYSKDILKTENINIVEGSGISRSNRISAKDLDNILKEFEPYSNLMRNNDNEFYKTGTLKGIRTRAGYFINSGDKAVRFVVMINTPGKSIEKIMGQVYKIQAQHNLSKRNNPNFFNLCP